MKTLGLMTSGSDVRAVEGVAVFCYQAKKWIGSFAAALGGLDTLLFAGSIGENAPLVRTRICRALGLGMASGKRKFDHATKYNSRLDPFSADGIPMIHGWGDQLYGLYLIAKPPVPAHY